MPKAVPVSMCPSRRTGASLIASALRSIPRTRHDDGELYPAFAQSQTRTPHLNKADLATTPAAGAFANTARAFANAAGASTNATGASANAAAGVGYCRAVQGSGKKGSYGGRRDHCEFPAGRQEFATIFVGVDVRRGFRHDQLQC